MKIDPKTARRLEALLAEVAGYNRAQVQAEEPAFDPCRVAGSPSGQEPGPAGPQVREPGPAGPAVPAPRPDPDQTRAFVTVFEDAPSVPGPLHGMTVAVKDLYDVAGVPTTAGSRIRAGHIARSNADAVQRLKDAGAILVGKTATHEFAYGCTTDSPFHGPVRNPLDHSRSPGGSSGGSAAAVSAGMADLALGTDTAGSVRIPAACCGVVGLKPTYGRISKAGIVPLSWTLDHPGLLARTVRVIRQALTVLTEPHAPEPVSSLKIGVPHDWLEGPVEPEVRQAFHRALDHLRAAGAEVRHVELPPLKDFHFVSRIITLAEAGAYHAAHLDRLDEYGPDVRPRIALGQHLLARDYLLAQQLRAGLCRRTAAVMAEVHALATPTMPVIAPLIGQRTWTYAGGHEEPVAEAMLRFTAPFNVTGQPAISIPWGPTPYTAVQLAGALHQDEELLQIADLLEGGA